MVCWQKYRSATAYEISGIPYFYVGIRATHIGKLPIPAMNFLNPGLNAAVKNGLIQTPLVPSSGHGLAHCASPRHSGHLTTLF